MKRDGHGLSSGAAPAATVVLADDSPLIRTRLAAMLSEVGGANVVGEAVDALEAVTLARQIQPDVLILDLAMPGGGGFAVLRELHSDEAAPVVVVLTNYTYPSYRKQCAALGAQFFFDKSGEFEKVIDVLAEMAAVRTKVGSG